MLIVILNGSIFISGLESVGVNLYFNAAEWHLNKHLIERKKMQFLLL